MATMEARMKALEEKMGQCEKRASDAETKLEEQLKRIKDCADGVGEIQEAASVTKDKMERVDKDAHETKSDLTTFMVETTDNINMVKADVENSVGMVINDAKKEFGVVRGELMELKSTVQGLAGAAQVKFTEYMEEMQRAKADFDGLEKGARDTFLEVKQKIEELERREGRGDSKMTGFLYTKNLAPKIFNGKPEDWRNWQQDTMEYFDDIVKGIKQVLEAAAKEEMNGDWKGQSQNIYRALKRFTDGDAKKVVMGVSDENGWKAWRELCKQYEAGVALRLNVAMQELMSMGQIKAKSVEDTKKLIPELERRIKEVEDLRGNAGMEAKALDDLTKKSLLEGILDVTTKQATATMVEFEDTYEEAKAKTLKVVNVMAATTPVSQEGQSLARNEEAPAVNADPWANAAARQYEGTQGTWDRTSGYGEGSLNRTGEITCYNCQEKGHIARNCTNKGSKGKGDGKSGFKGKGKGEGKGGKGRGPATGCFACGGPHYQSDCPNKGKGKGAGKSLSWSKGGGAKGQARSLTGWEEWSPQTYWGDGTNLQYGEVKEFATALVTIEEGDEKWKVVKSKKAKVKENDDKTHDDEYKKAEDKKHDDESKKTKVNTKKAWRKRRAAEKKEQKSEQDVTSCQVCAGNVAILQTVTPEHVAELSCTGEWEVIELAVDSGATEIVLPEESLKSVAMHEGEASKRGVMYEVANGVQIPNLGEKKFVGISEEGVARGLKAQIAEVNKGLLSVAKVVKNGNRVVFEESGSYIEDCETGERMWLQEVGGMYMLKMWVRNPGFRRHG